MPTPRVRKVILNARTGFARVRASYNKRERLHPLQGKQGAPQLRARHVHAADEKWLEIRPHDLPLEQGAQGQLPEVNGRLYRERPTIKNTTPSAKREGVLNVSGNQASDHTTERVVSYNNRHRS